MIASGPIILGAGGPTISGVKVGVMVFVGVRDGVLDGVNVGVIV
jgi:hypothetical protein